MVTAQMNPAPVKLVLRVPVAAMVVAAGVDNTHNVSEPQPNQQKHKRGGPIGPPFLFTVCFEAVMF
jgi:hypothetical protein